MNRLEISATLVLALSGLACLSVSETVGPSDTDAGLVDTGMVAAADSGVIDSPDGGMPIEDAGGLALDATLPPDAGTRPDSGIVDPCDPLRQTGCATAPMTKCVVENPLMPKGGTRCATPADTDKLRDATCDVGKCTAGLVCVQTSSAASGGSLCRQVCDPFTGEGCSSLGNDFDCRLQLLDTNWGACVTLPRVCDALNQTPCAPNQACQPSTRLNGTVELRCRNAGTALTGSACGGGVTCARGLMCVRDSSSAGSTCRQVCAFKGQGGASNCPSETPNCNGKLMIGSDPLYYCINQP